MEAKTDIDPAVVEACAEHSHNINRAYCIALGDTSQSAWTDAPDWQKDSARNGVRAVLTGAATTPEQQHASWLAQKQREGWTYGPVKDPIAKTHPCFVPYADLPPSQKTKDALYVNAVRGILVAHGVEIAKTSPA